MSDRVFNVLFLCTGNSARSILAEAALTREGMGRFNAYSAGSHPTGQVNSLTLLLLDKLNYNIGFARSKSWDEFAGPDAPQMDFVFTVCDGAASETCPIWSGTPMKAHWGVADPAAATGSEAERLMVFSETYRMLAQRVSIFVNLPFDSLDQLALGEKLKAIGAGT